MKLRIKGIRLEANKETPAKEAKSIKASKKTFTKKAKPTSVLEVHLQHGDVVTMCDNRLQAFTEVSNNTQLLTDCG